MAQPSASLIGRKLGTYKLLALLGSGGMGEVYRARDDRLDRDVAIKVLPSSLTSDADRRARFEREAKMLAALNHPGIAAIYGYEEADGVHGLVLELVEGPTLAERIAAGPLALGDAVAIGAQLAEALEAAHAKGIVHRDLKPANLKVAPDGRVKVLDFGLARTFEPDVPPAHHPADAATVADGLSHAGVILGTTAYMSPEQARGAAVDKRTDIWAFGCVLYEMLAGRQAFAAPTASDAIAAIIERDPDWDALPAKTPPAVRQLLRRCLEKDARRRLRDIGDARLELNDSMTAGASQTRAAAPFATVRPRRRFVVAAILLVVLAAAGIWAGIGRWTRPQATAGAQRLSDGNRASANADANAYYEQALLFGGAGIENPKQAEHMLQRALALDPQFAAARAETAFFLVARILTGRSNDASLFYQAEGEVRRALRDDPRCGRAHSVLGLIYLLQGRSELVRAELDLALSENPSDPTVRMHLLNLHRLNGDYAQALEQADTLTRQWPTAWPAHLDRGEILREQGDIAGAIREQERVLEQDARNIAAIGALTRAHLDAGDVAKARLTLQRALDQDRGNYGLRQQRALLLALEGKKSEAAQEMDADLLTYAGMQAWGPAEAADFYAVMGDADTALTWLDRSVRMGDLRESYLRRNPLLAGVRGHPRFQQILDAVAYRRQQRAGK